MERPIEAFPLVWPVGQRRTPSPRRSKFGGNRPWTVAQAFDPDKGGGQASANQMAELSAAYTEGMRELGAEGSP